MMCAEHTVKMKGMTCVKNTEEQASGRLTQELEHEKIRTSPEYDELREELRQLDMLREFLMDEEEARYQELKEMIGLEEAWRGW